jgi:enoyl-CoA hydratase
MTYENLLLEKDGQVATITIHRPKVLNALDLKTLEELEGAATDLTEDAAIRAVVLTGAGDKAFVAGADIAALSTMTTREALAFADFGHKVLNLLDRMPKPVIAAVNGYALGGGCELALACDFIYAADTAQLGLPEVNLGVIPGFGGTQRLARRVGPGMAREMIFTGARLSAQRAREVGLVNEVVPRAELLARVMEVCRAICQKGPVAIAQAKRAIRLGADISLTVASELERQTFAALFATEDLREGTRAFLEKRPARFQGR